MEGHCDSITSLSRFSLSLTLSVIVISLSSQLCTQRYNSSECLSPLSLSLSFLPLFRIPYPSSSSASSACTSTIKQQAAAGFSREFVSLNHWMRLRAFDTPKTTTPTPTTTTTTSCSCTAYHQSEGRRRCVWCTRASISPHPLSLSHSLPSSARYIHIQSLGACTPLCVCVCVCV